MISSQEISQIIDSSQSSFMMNDVAATMRAPTFGQELASTGVSGLATIGLPVAGFAATWGLMGMGGGMGLIKSGWQAGSGLGRAASLGATGLGGMLARGAGGVVGAGLGLGVGMLPFLGVEMAVDYAGGQIVEGAQQYMMGQTMMGQVGQYAGGFGSQSAMGSGLFPSDLQSMASFGVDVFEFGRDYGLSQDSTMGLAVGMTQAGMLGNLQGPGQFVTAFKAKLRQVQELSRALDSTLEEAAGVMSELSGMGISDVNQVSLGRRLGSISTLTGQSLTDVMGATAGAVQMGAALGVSPDTAANLGASNLASISTLGRTGAIDQTLLLAAGGINGLAQNMTQQMLMMPATEGGLSLIQRLVNSSGTDIDPSRLVDVISGDRPSRRRIDPYAQGELMEDFLEDAPSIVLGQVGRIRSRYSTELEANRHQYQFMAQLGIGDPRMQEAMLQQFRMAPTMGVLESAQGMLNEAQIEDEAREQSSGTLRRFFDAVGRGLDDSVGEGLRNFGYIISQTLEAAGTDFSRSFSGTGLVSAPIHVTPEMVQGYTDRLTSGQSVGFSREDINRGMFENPGGAFTERDVRGALSRYFGQEESATMTGRLSQIQRGEAIDLSRIGVDLWGVAREASGYAAGMHLWTHPGDFQGALEASDVSGGSPMGLQLGELRRLDASGQNLGHGENLAATIPMALLGGPAGVLAGTVTYGLLRVLEDRSEIDRAYFGRSPLAAWAVTEGAYVDPDTLTMATASTEDVTRFSTFMATAAGSRLGRRMGRADAKETRRLVADALGYSENYRERTLDQAATIDEALRSTLSPEQLRDRGIAINPPRTMEELIYGAARRYTAGVVADLMGEAGPTSRVNAAMESGSGMHGLGTLDVANMASQMFGGDAISAFLERQASEVAAVVGTSDNWMVRMGGGEAGAYYSQEQISPSPPIDYSTRLGSDITAAPDGEAASRAARILEAGEGLSSERVSQLLAFSGLDPNNQAHVAALRGLSESSPIARDAFAAWSNFTNLGGNVATIANTLIAQAEMDLGAAVGEDELAPVNFARIAKATQRGTPGEFLATEDRLNDTAVRAGRMRSFYEQATTITTRISENVFQPMLTAEGRTQWDRMTGDPLQRMREILNSTDRSRYLSENTDVSFITNTLNLLANPQDVMEGALSLDTGVETAMSWWERGEGRNATPQQRAAFRARMEERFSTVRAGGPEDVFGVLMGTAADEGISPSEAATIVSVMPQSSEILSLIASGRSGLEREFTRSATQLFGGQSEFESWYKELEGGRYDTVTELIDALQKGYRGRPGGGEAMSALLQEIGRSGMLQTQTPDAQREGRELRVDANIKRMTDLLESVAHGTRSLRTRDVKEEASD